MLWIKIIEYLHRYAPSSIIDVPAKIVVTNDPDHGKLDDYKRVFSMLNRLNIKITTSVFCKIENVLLIKSYRVARPRQLTLRPKRNADMNTETIPKASASALNLSPEI